MIHMQLFHYLTLYADRQNENKVLLIIHPHIVGNNLGILCIRSLGFFKISYERLFFYIKMNWSEKTSPPVRQYKHTSKGAWDQASPKWKWYQWK